MPSKAAPSLPFSMGWGRKNKREGSWIEIRTEDITYQLPSLAKETNFEEIRLIYYQSKQSRIMRNKVKSLKIFLHLPLLL